LDVHRTGLSLRTRVLTALTLMHRVSDAPPKATQYGPVGHRSQHNAPTGTLSATFSVVKDRYTLEFRFTTTPESTPIAIMRWALRLAELQEDVPQFTPEETDQVFAVLQERLGDPKS